MNKKQVELMRIRAEYMVHNDMLAYIEDFEVGDIVRNVINDGEHVIFEIHTITTGVAGKYARLDNGQQVNLMFLNKFKDKDFYPKYKRYGIILPDE